MNPNEIRIILLRAGVSQASISRAVGVTRQSINDVIRGKFASDNIRRQIAKFSGVPVETIWPEDYLSPGGPRKRGRPTHKAKALRNEMRKLESEI